MKTALLCATAGGLAFVLAAWQLGLRVPGPKPREFSGQPEQEKPDQQKKPEPIRASFPADLIPAAQCRSGAPGRRFKAEAHTHKMAVLKTTGALHPWQDHLKEEWQAERVEETELVLVVGEQKKTFIDLIHFQEGPPVARYKHAVEVSMVEAKTGKVLANRVIVNMPRAIYDTEAWALTALGRPVPWSPVFHWAVSRIRPASPTKPTSHPWSSRSNKVVGQPF